MRVLRESDLRWVAGGYYDSWGAWIDDQDGTNDPAWFPTNASGQDIRDELGYYPEGHPGDSVNGEDGNGHGGDNSWMDPVTADYMDWVNNTGDYAPGNHYLTDGDPYQESDPGVAVNNVEGAILQDHGISAEIGKYMEANHLKTADVLAPGIYQVAFRPEVAGIGLPAFHSEYIYVHDGITEMLSAAPDHNGKLSTVTGNFDDVNQDHGLGFITGTGQTSTGYQRQNEGAMMYTVQNNSGLTDAQTWANMNQTAQSVAPSSGSTMNYNVLFENSNSVFATVGSQNGLTVYTYNMPGASNNLTEITSGQRPMDPSLVLQ